MHSGAGPGADHAVALTAGGTLLSWGSGQQGQLGRVGSRLPERTARATLLQPHPVPFTRRIRGVGAPKITDFACGTYSTFALAQGGRVYAWGLNNYGQLALPGQARRARSTPCLPAVPQRCIQGLLACQNASLFQSALPSWVHSSSGGG
jgi:alpha-tubulin suppressor-like RCC1 family protein